MKKKAKENRFLEKIFFIGYSNDGHDSGISVLLMVKEKKVCRQFSLVPPIRSISQRANEAGLE